MSTLHDTLYETAVPSTCAYVSKKGTRCTREPIEGETSCVLHGASMPLAHDQSRRRLLALQEKSLQTIEDLLLTADDKTRLVAAIAVLDRTGLGPKTTVAVESAGDLSNYSDTQLLEELDAINAKARATLQRPQMNEAPLTPPSAGDTRH